MENASQGLSPSGNDVNPSPMAGRFNRCDEMFDMHESRSVESVKSRDHWQLSWVDFCIVSCLIAAGFLFLRNPQEWASNAYIGKDQFGDAAFWWQGALQLARGMFWDNVNFMYRMGYAVFAGLISAIIGPNYALFHSILTLIFLGVASVAYLVLARYTGRIVALAMIFALAFSPMQAEWLAVSTSDALGLILNLVALVALVLAASVRPRFKWLILAGLFISFAGLTRPLMTLLIVPAAVIIFVRAHGSFSRKMLAMVVFGAAFSAPTLTWMAALYQKTGYFSLAGSDASSFFAASTRKYQVWNPDMYPPVMKAAEERYGTAPNPRQINDEFWRQTVRNYRSQWRYHLKRLIPNLRRTAAFSHQQIQPGDNIEFALRLLARGGLGLVLAMGGAMAGNRVRAAAVLATVGLSLWPSSMPWVVIVCGAWFLLSTFRQGSSPVGPIVAAYWWTGAAAMILVGGISGPTLGTLAMNALGYRLGLQFLFCNDWLVLLGMAAIAGPQRYALPRAVGAWLAPKPLPRLALRALGVSALASLFCLLVSGAVVAGLRAWAFGSSTREPMPAVLPFVAAFCREQHAGAARIDKAKAASVYEFGSMWNGPHPADRFEGARIFTGAIGGLLWQIAGQERTRALFHIQSVRTPFIIGPESDVEFEQFVPEDAWRNRQGLFVLRSFRENESYGGILWREGLPQVQLFAPLGRHGRSFDFHALQRFPVARSAGALEKGLKVSGGILKWFEYPIDRAHRWFIIEPPTKPAPSRTVSLDLDVSNAVGRQTLAFSFRVEPLPGYLPTNKQALVSVDALGSQGKTQNLIARTTSSRGTYLDTAAELLNIQVPASTSRVRVNFPDVQPMEYIRVIEFKIISDDVRPTLAEQFCTGAPENLSKPDL